jgi:hypothetical protein
LLHIVVPIRAIGRFIASDERYSESAATGKVWRGWFGSSKVYDHYVIFPPNDVAVSTSDRLHGTNSSVSFRWS